MSHVDENWGRPVTFLCVAYALVGKKRTKKQEKKEGRNKPKDNIVQNVLWL